VTAPKIRPAMGHYTLSYQGATLARIFTPAIIQVIRDIAQQAGGLEMNYHLIRVGSVQEARKAFELGIWPNAPISTEMANRLISLGMAPEIVQEVKWERFILIGG